MTPTPKGERVRALDLFSGIGGFSLGLEQTGAFKTVGFCDIDAFCRRVLARHWPDVPCHEDITTREFVKGEADVICGGFPCQDISSLGKRAGLSGARSGLWREMVRAIRVVRPLYVIVENVADLLHRGMGVVCGELAESGYDLEWDCIPARALRAPHGRDRVWIVAYADGGRGRSNPSGRHNANRNDSRRSQTDSLSGALSEQRHSGKMAAASHADGTRGLQPGWCFSEVRRRINDRSAAPPEWSTPWPEKLSQIQGMDDGLSDRLDKAGIDATGNAVVPAIPKIIGEAIIAASITQGESRAA